jgi:hypothetical protein
VEWYEGHNITRREGAEERKLSQPASQHVIFIMEEKQPTRQRGTKREDEGDVDDDDDDGDGYA